MKKAERVDWRKRVKDLATPHEAYERVRGTRSEAYGIEEHIKNLKRISVAEKGKYPNPEKIIRDFSDEKKVYLCKGVRYELR